MQQKREEEETQECLTGRKIHGILKTSNNCAAISQIPSFPLVSRLITDCEICWVNFMPDRAQICTIPVTNPAIRYIREFIHFTAAFCIFHATLQQLSLPSPSYAISPTVQRNLSWDQVLKYVECRWTFFRRILGTLLFGLDAWIRVKCIPKRSRK
jgi:hypothetical protein